MCVSVEATGVESPGVVVAVPGGCRKLEMQSPGKGSLDPFLIVEPSLQTHLSFTQTSISFYLHVGLCVCVRVYSCEYTCPKS